MKTRILALFLLTSLLIGTVSACKCVEPSVYRDYRDDDNTNVFHAEVKNEVVQGSNRKYRVEMIKNFKGCSPEEGKKFWVTTAASSAACGARLEVGHTYLLFANKASNLYTINSCDPNKKWSDLSVDEEKFLLGRQYECNGKQYCANGGSAYLKCSEGCPACDYEKKGITCETSVCRGCGLHAAYLYYTATFEPAECKSS